MKQNTNILVCDIRPVGRVPFRLDKYNLFWTGFFAFRERKLPMEEKKELLDQDERVVEIELERLRGFVNHAFDSI